MTTKIKQGDRVIIQNRGDGWDGITGVAQTASSTGDVWVAFDDPMVNPLRIEGATWTVKAGYIKKLTKKVLLELLRDAKTTENALRNRIENLIDDLDRARRSESVEVQRTAALIREKTDLEIQVEDLLKGRTNDLATMQELYLEINGANAALDYAFSDLLNQRQRNRLAGFRSGYAQRAIDVPTPEH